MLLHHFHCTLSEDHPVERPSQATWLPITPLIHALGVTHHSLADTAAHQQRQHPFCKSQVLLHVALMQVVVLHDKKYKSLQWMTLYHKLSVTIVCITCDPIHHLDSPNVVTLYWFILHTTREWSVIVHVWIKCSYSAIVKFRPYAESHLL